PGYPELSELEFLPTRARFDYVTHDFQLDEIDLIHVASFTSQNRFDRHTSWDVRVGALRLDDAGCRCLAGRLALGGGAAAAWLDEALTLFFTVEGELASAPSLDGIAGVPLRLGVGPRVGARIRLAARLVWLIQGQWLWQ